MSDRESINTDSCVCARVCVSMCLNKNNSIESAVMTESLDVLKNGKRSEVRDEVKSYRLTR